MSILSDISNVISSAVQMVEGAAMTALEAEFAPLEIAQSVTNLATQALGQALLSALPQLQSAGMPGFLAKDIQQLIKNVMQQLTHPSNPATDNHVNKQAGSQINNLAQSLVQGIINAILQAIQQNKGSGGGSGTGGAQGTGGSQGSGGATGSTGTTGSTGSQTSGSWLEALAKALGDKLNQKAQQVQSQANSVDGSNPGQVTQLQAETQLFSLMMNAFNDVIKTIGQGLSTMANKE
jgi:hypothetical protein